MDQKVKKRKEDIDGKKIIGKTEQELDEYLRKRRVIV